jgi:hypothetical protein
VRSRLCAVLALTLALACMAAIASVFSSSEHSLGTTSPSALASSPDDDLGDGGPVAVVPQPLLVAFLAFVLALALAVTPPSGVGASEQRRARAPPAPRTS